MFEGRELVAEKRCNGRFLSKLEFLGSPAIATIPPRRHAAPERAEYRFGPVKELPVAPPQARVRVVGVRPREQSGVEIAKARVMVSARRPSAGGPGCSRATWACCRSCRLLRAIAREAERLAPFKGCSTASWTFEGP